MYELCRERRSFEKTVSGGKETSEERAFLRRFYILSARLPRAARARSFGVNNDFRQEIDHYINWYNHKRIKLSLGGLSPIQYRHHLGFAA